MTVFTHSSDLLRFSLHIAFRLDILWVADLAEQVDLLFLSEIFCFLWGFVRIIEVLGCACCFWRQVEIFPACESPESGLVRGGNFCMYVD